MTFTSPISVGGCGQRELTLLVHLCEFCSRSAVRVCKKHKTINYLGSNTKFDFLIGCKVGVGECKSLTVSMTHCLYVFFFSGMLLLPLSSVVSHVFKPRMLRSYSFLHSSVHIVFHNRRQEHRVINSEN